MAIAMLSTQPPGSLLTCNGYKDTEYMELVRCNLLAVSAAISTSMTRAAR